MTRLQSVAFAWLLVGVGCSTPGQTGGSSGGATPRGAGSSAPIDAAPSHAASPTPAECTNLFAHAVAIRVAEQRAQVPATQLPTEVEQAELRARLEAEAGPACRAGSRATYECGMAAKTLADFEACR